MLKARGDVVEDPGGTDMYRLAYDLTVGGDGEGAVVLKAMRHVVEDPGARTCTA